jgi:hypothetical protein
LLENVNSFLVLKYWVSVLWRLVQVLFAEWSVKPCFAALVVNVVCVPYWRVSTNYALLASQPFPQSPTRPLEELAVSHVFADLDIAVLLAEVKNLS